MYEKKLVAALLLLCGILLFSACMDNQTSTEADTVVSSVEAASSSDAIIRTAPSSITEETPETVLSRMSLKEKVGQLFVIRPEQLLTTISETGIHDTEQNGITSLNADMKKILADYPAGGFAIFGKNIETPAQLKTLNAELKAACSIPPIIAVDEEGGSVARIANAKGFHVPKVNSMEAIGKTGNPLNAQKAASDIGQYLSEYGFTMDFAPDADINTNPHNIVIGNRAFGNDPALVSTMVSAYIDGLHRHGIAGTIKHFPGHGDTNEDTHSGYVAVHKTWDELLNMELIPFQENLHKTDAVMIAHITLDHVTSDGLPATLSKELVTDKLRKELGYDGVIITDALAMGAVEKHYSSAEAAVLAFDAGNDILLMPYSYTDAFDGILNAVEDGRISEQRLNESVLRILQMKYRYL